MLQYKPVTVERLICTCDRCGRSIDKDQDMMEWQERFIISFRAGFGSVFGDGSLVEGDFCQECIQAVLGKWLRVKNDDPFESKHTQSNDAEKLLQTYQHRKQEEGARLQQELSDIISGTDERVVKRRQLAERLDVPASQVDEVAIDHMLAATEHLAKKGGTPETVQQDQGARINR